MASSINPNNIDGSYPVAGQDNNSQGFRDNFTNTKTNFQYAAAEITDLQNKVVLKAALTGTVLNNDMNDSLLSNARFQNISETKVNLGSDSTLTIDYAAGPYQTVTLTQPVTISFINFPTTNLARCRLQVTVSNIGYTLTLPGSPVVLNGTSNIQGINGNTISFNRTGVYEYEFETSDGGTTVSVFDLNRNRDPIYLPSSEEVNSGGTASLDKTTTMFSTTGSAATLSLPAGSEGQIKVLAMEAASGNMVVTVFNAGWKATGNGSLTFNQIGQTATLLFTNGKWYVIGTGPGSGNSIPLLG